MINALIVEDEERSSRVLETILTTYCQDVKIAGIARTVEDARQMIAASMPDLVFLDIHLPDGNSFLLLDDVITPDMKIIFVTAHNEYALKALKCSALDYILKPVEIDELVAAVEKYKMWSKSSRYATGLKALKENLRHERKEKIKIVGLSTVNEIQFVPTEQIIRLEAASNYTHFVISDMPRITVSHTLKYYEDILDEDEFMRVHHSHIVNLKKVKKYIKGKVGSLLMSDGCTIDVSPRHKDDFLRKISGLNY